jgi:hypothetical protein
VENHPNWIPNAGNMLVLAMAHHRLKQAAEARQWLDRARQTSPPKTGPELEPPNDVVPLGREWLEWIGFQLLHHEAEVLLKAAPIDSTDDR